MYGGKNKRVLVIEVCRGEFLYGLFEEEEGGCFVVVKCMF